MKTLKYICILFIGFAFVTGCSGNYGELKRQPESVSKVTQQDLIDNWSDYNIWLNYYHKNALAVIVFDPKNDNSNILVNGTWDTVKDQKMWTKIVKENTTSEGDFRMVWSGHDSTTGVQEILGSDNQLYGFIIYQENVTQWVNLMMVDENTMRLSWERATFLERPPPRGRLDWFNVEVE